MPSLFDNNRTYVLGDEELSLIGDREKLAQWRHKGLGPAYYKLGRKILYPPPGNVAGYGDIGPEGHAGKRRCAIA